MFEVSSRAEALPRDQVIELFERFKAGDTAAGWELAVSQQRLIAKICNRWEGYLGTNTEDLIQEYTLKFFTSLPDFDPATMSIREFTLKITDRLGQTCRKLACRPLHLPTYRRLYGGGSIEPSDLPKCESHYDEILAKLRDIDDAVDACSKITPAGVLVLRLLAKGMNYTEVLNQLLESFPEALPNGRRNWRNKLNALIDSALNEIREVLGESKPVSNARGRCLVESEVELIIKNALSATNMSPVKLSRYLLNEGLRVSWDCLNDFFHEYEIRRRQKMVSQSPDVFDRVAAETLAQWRLKTHQNLPSADEMRMPDEMWKKIESLIFIFRCKAIGRLRNCRAKTDGLIYKIRTGCKVTQIPHVLCADQVQYGGWRKTLKRLGILEQVLDIAEEYYPDMAEARAKYGS